MDNFSSLVAVEPMIILSHKYVSLFVSGTRGPITHHGITAEIGKDTEVILQTGTITIPTTDNDHTSHRYLALLNTNQIDLKLGK